MKFRINDSIAYMANKLNAILNQDTSENPMVEVPELKGDDKKIHFKFLIYNCLLITEQLYKEHYKDIREIDVPFEEAYEQLKKYMNNESN